MPKISEIITNPPRDEYIDQYLYKFSNAEAVAKIKDLTLKKVSSTTDIEYGLFDQQNRLVGYLSLEYFAKDIWLVTLVQLAQAYKGMGYGTFLYDYAVMNDKLNLLSDATNTDGINGSKNLWLSLYTKHRYDVVGYDIKTKTVMKDVHPDIVYNNDPDIRWLALASNKTINESITEIQSYMKNRYVVWYGPGTTTEHYFNF